jgi:5-formyltetrahydrofolate cyclo-ligase
LASVGVVLKSVIRSEILKRLSNLSASDRAHMSLNIQNNLKKQLLNETGLWVGYQPMASEPQVNWSEVSNKISWAFPVVENETEISFKKFSKNFHKSVMGVHEPIDGETVQLSEVSGFVVPAVAFDKQGVRLGRGKGYYDRNLKNFNKKKIGVCFELALCESLPAEQHDLRCETIITEIQILKVNQSEGDQKWN